MIKHKVFTLLLLFIITSHAHSQDYLGISTGNYAGVTGLSLQPASIVDSRHKFDLNLFSTGINYSNNYLLVDREAILKFNKKNFEKYDVFKQRYLTESTLAPGEKVFFNIGNRVQLPLSFMATTGKKSAIAFNMQLRSVVQGRDISSDFAKLAYNNFYSPALNNTSIDASGISVNALNWASAGFTYGRVLYNSDKHFFKAAFTGKYLAGMSSINFSSSGFNLQVNTDSSFNFNTRSFNYNHNKNADYNIILDKKFEPDAEAFGFDAGLVYEYRGNLNNFKYIRNDDERSSVADRRDVNKYIFKLGISILDAGRFTFNKPSNVNSFSANINNWDLKNANYGSLNQFDSALASRVTANANDARNYTVHLPTALSVQADIRFVKGLFLNVMSYQPLDIDNKVGTRFNNYGYFAITPRYERRHFGIYVPYSIANRNDFSGNKDHALGLTLRGGPFFIGSSNLGTMAFKKQLRSADVHLGFKVGITYGKPNKANRLLEKTFNKKDASVTAATVFLVGESAKTPRDTGRLLMNYKDGNIYENPEQRGNVIIINNYYYGNEKVKVDTVIKIKEEIKMAENKFSSPPLSDTVTKIILDSISINTADSLREKRMKMDSLIRSLQQLQQKLDSNMKDAAAKDTALKIRRQQLVLQDSSNMKMRDSVFIPAKKVDLLPAKKHSVLNAESQIDTMKVIKQMAANRDSVIVVEKQLQPQIYRDVDAFNQNEAALKLLQAEEKKRRQQNDDFQKDLNKQYEQYASQANSLSKDIEKLNDRLANPTRYYQSSTNYVPVYNKPEPYYVNVPTYIPVENKRDTTYIKDTVWVIDSSLARIDTVIKKMPVFVEAVVQPQFDYTSLPAEIVLFELGDAKLDPIYHSRLLYIAKILKGDSTLAVEVIGHTDPSGSLQINEKLSRLRAEAVAKYLKENGVIDQQVRTQALASIYPAVKGSNSAADRQNRRVEVKLVKVTQ